MAIAGTTRYTGGLVDLGAGQISRDIFVSDTVMDITDARSSEHNLRNFYRRWAEFMDAESWDDLATWRRRNA